MEGPPNPKTRKKKKKAWEMPENQRKSFKRILLMKLQSYWDVKDISFQDLEDELNQRCRPLLNFIKGIEEENKWLKVFTNFVMIILCLEVAFEILDMIFYCDNVVDLITKFLNLILLIFIFITWFLFRNNHTNANQLFTWLRDLHAPDNNLINRLLENQTDKIKTSLKISMFACKMFRKVMFIAIILLYIVKPIIFTLISGEISNIVPIPYKIVPVSNETALGIIIHWIVQYLTIMAFYFVQSFLASFIFITAIHAYIVGDIT